MIRTFTALGMDEALQRFLSGIIDYGARELPMLDWVDPASIHFTLAFLGELNDVELTLVMEATQAAAQVIPPFTYQLKSLRIHRTPSQMHIRMDVEDQPSPQMQGSPLQLAYHALTAELEQRQLKDKNQQFLPHLSLARTRLKLSSPELLVVQRLIQTMHASMSAQLYSARYLALMQSEPSTVWPKYTCLGKYAFALGI